VEHGELGAGATLGVRRDGSSYKVTESVSQNASLSPSPRLFPDAAQAESFESRANLFSSLSAHPHQHIQPQLVITRKAEGR
jgi:hypothetical protein